MPGEETRSQIEAQAKRDALIENINEKVQELVNTVNDIKNSSQQMQHSLIKGEGKMKATEEKVDRINNQFSKHLDDHFNKDFAKTTRWEDMLPQIISSTVAALIVSIAIGGIMAYTLLNKGG